MQSSKKDVRVCALVYMHTSIHREADVHGISKRICVAQLAVQLFILESLNFAVNVLQLVIRICFIQKLKRLGLEGL